MLALVFNYLTKNVYIFALIQFNCTNGFICKSKFWQTLHVLILFKIPEINQKEELKLKNISVKFFQN